MNPYVEITIRSIIGFFSLWLFARVLGSRQISQLTFYDYVVGITIGSIAGTLCVDRDIPILYSIIAIAIWVFGVFVFELLTNKSIILRRVFSGCAKVLISEGEIIGKNLKLTRFDINDLLRELRSMGYFNVADIQFAILETNGKVSVLPKENVRPLQPADMEKNLPEKSLVTNIIIDGKIMEENLATTKKDKQWVQDQLNSQGKGNIKNIILATLDDNYNLSVYEKGSTTDYDTVFQ